MLEVLCSTKGIQAARIGPIAVALLIAASSGGCATLMQAVQPTAALVEPELNSRSSASDEVSANSATPPVDSQWITHVYRGWAGPSSEM